MNDVHMYFIALTDDIVAIVFSCNLQYKINDNLSVDICAVVAGIYIFLYSYAPCT